VARHRVVRADAAHPRSDPPRHRARGVRCRPGERERALRTQLSALDDLAFSSPLALVPALAKVPGPFGPLARVRAEVRRTDGLLFEEIIRRRAEPDAATRPDILSLLLSAQDDQGQPLTDTELRDELVSALLAGTHTTGTAMAWCFERLLSEPEARDKVVAELAEVAGGGPVGPEHWSRLRYLDAAIKEALRLRPIRPGRRPAPGQAAVRDRRLRCCRRAPRSAAARTSRSKIQRCIRIPSSTDPKRFLDAKVDPYAFAAFGGGIRRCLGMAFALNLLKGVIATALSRTSLAIVSPHARPARHAFFVAPEAGLQVQLGGAATG